MKSKIIIEFVFLLSFITYNSSLAQVPSWLWVNKIITPYIYCTTTDKVGNVYVCGGFGSTIQFDTIELKAKDLSMFIVKFNSEGKAIWARTTEFESGTSIARAISIAPDGNIYVTGKFEYPGCKFGNYNLIVKDQVYQTSDVFIVKYNSDGNLIWAKSVGGACGYTEAFSAAADSKGDVYIAGFFQAQYILLDTIRLNKSSIACGSIGCDLFIAKYNTKGKALWAKSTGGPNDIDCAYGVATDKKDNVFLTGHFQSTSISFDTISLNEIGGEKIFIAKFDSKGNTLWAKKERRTSNSYSVAIDKKGDCFITGWFASDTLVFGKDTLYSIKGTNVCVLKYDSDGNRIWGRAASKHPSVTGYSVTTDSLDNVYIGGWFTKQPFAFDTVTVPCDTGLFITKYDSSGKFNWVKCVEGHGKIRALHCDKFGNIYMAGYFTDTLINFDSIPISQKAGTFKFIAKLAPSLFTTIKSAPETKADLLLYPNPCTDELTINVSHFQNVKHLITVYDIHGTVVFQTQSPHNTQTQTAHNAQTTITINTRSFPPGLYLTRIQSPNSTTTRKFIKF